MTTSAGPITTGLHRVLERCRRVVGADWPVTAAALLGLLATVEVALRPAYRDGSAGGELAIELLLGLAATAPLALVRNHLYPAAGVVLLANTLTFATGQPPTAAGMVAQIAVPYLLARHNTWQVGALILSWLVVHSFAAATTGQHVIVWVLLAVCLSTGLGRVKWIRRAIAENDAARQAMADTAYRLAASGERARIARELHDVVAHHISMIAVQAETARLATPGMPDEGARRLLAIGDTARTALTEMRRLLGVLRDDSEVDTDRGRHTHGGAFADPAGRADVAARTDSTAPANPARMPDRSPQPGLQQLNELIDDVRDSARSSTRLIVRGQVTALDPGIELTAFRLVQEALTNVRRHAPGAAVDVELDYTDTALCVQVRDNGPGAAESVLAATGHGLLGMQERVAMVGGTVNAGPAAGTGFVVHAVLPRAEP